MEFEKIVEKDFSGCISVVKSGTVNKTIEEANHGIIGA